MTHEELIVANYHRRFRYNPDTGHHVNRKTGKISGSPTHRSRWYLKIGGFPWPDREHKTKWLYAHQLAVLAMTGSLPPVGYDVHHRDDNGLNNTWDNLQVLSFQHHIWSRKPGPDHPTGQFGVTVRTYKDGKKVYRAVYKSNGVKTRCKTYPFTPEGLAAAIAQRKAWEKEFRF